jgi:hypothetical protein
MVTIGNSMGGDFGLQANSVYSRKWWYQYYEMRCGMGEASEIFMRVKKETGGERERERECVCACVRAGVEEGRLGS